MRARRMILHLRALTSHLRIAAQCGSVVFKIMPMEGDTPVNGEAQKGAADLLAEVEIALALSALRGPIGGSNMLQSLPHGVT